MPGGLPPSCPLIDKINLRSYPKCRSVAPGRKRIPCFSNIMIKNGESRCTTTERSLNSWFWSRFRLADKGIIRNRRKIEAATANARVFLDIRDRSGSFSSWMWSFVDGSPISNRWQSQSDLPAETELSRKMSKELRRLGFRFLGPVVVYSHMQAVGMVNDHLEGCFRYAEVSSLNSISSSTERSSTPASDSI